MVTLSIWQTCLPGPLLFLYYDVGDLISPTEPTSSGNAHTVAPPATSAGTNHNMDDDIFAGIDLKPKMEVRLLMYQSQKMSKAGLF